MRAQLAKRYLDLLCSVYLYNEHRGYSGLDRIIAEVRKTSPEGDTFLVKMEKHRADERKHYVMFRRWFERRGEMPYHVGRTGQIDGIIEMFFGRGIDGLESDPILADKAKFAKLCRAIALTERRGMRQVEEFLVSPLVKADPHLMKIMKVIERDEPSHWEPYEEWLQVHGFPQARRRDRLADSLTHVVVVLGKFPFLLANVWLPRLTEWPDQHERAAAVPGLDESAAVES